MKKTIILAVTLLISIAFLPQTVFGIGQVTKPIVIKDALRGQEASAVLDLFNSKDVETLYGLSAEGEIAEWVSFYEIEDEDLETPVTEVQISPKSYLKVSAKFDIPEDTPNGEYSGKVYIFTAPIKDEETGEMKTTVSQRVGRKISITVTDDEIIKFDTAIIPLKYSVEKDKPFKIKIIYTNQGNVTVKPDVKLKITKDDKTIFNAVFPYPEDEKAVRTSERKTLPLIEWQTIGQEIGRYKAEIDILHNGEVVKNDSFNFSIKEPDESDGFGAGGSVNFFAGVGGGNIIFGYLLVGGLILASLLLIIKNRFKRKQRA